MSGLTFCQQEEGGLAMFYKALLDDDGPAFDVRVKMIHDVD